ncbi:gliding motility-associated C-terminal domain-containing protein [Algoriphagus confluentis]|uniref:PKD domain-containing protein n=1 Tax=Algoriphagus confluentis TaxID=1697556 RepID=A0ABQ6PQH7_9BACT|nr:hypothetical protein Aconfl_28340 [Algoriphagus confluentis]
MFQGKRIGVLRIGMMSMLAFIPFYSFSQFAFNIPDRSSQRIHSYADMGVEVSGILALCSHSEKGSINLSVYGGRAPYSFKWNTNETTQNRTNLNAGTYTVWITDSDGKTIEKSIVIQPPFPLILNPVEKKDASCGSGKDGYAKISVKIGRNDYEEDSPPYEVTWSNGLKNVWEASNLAPGVYTVTVGDKYFCETSISFEIKAASEGLTLTESIQNIGCSTDQNGKINLNVSGGQGPYTYKWSHGPTSSSLENLAAGTYQVQVQDSKGCTVQASYLILAPAPLLLGETVSEPSCAGNADGTIQLKPTGGKAPYSFSWNTGSNASQISGLASGVYTVTVTDASGCQAQKQFNLSNSSGLQVEVLENKPVTCSGNPDGSVLLGIKGALGNPSIIWSDGKAGGEKRTDLAPGTYSVEITDESGCVVAVNFSIEQNQGLKAKIETALEVDCAKGEISGLAWVTIEGGVEPYQVTWASSESSREISFRESGKLKVDIVDALGCRTTAETLVEIPNGSTLDSRIHFGYRKLTITSEPEVLVKEEILFESEIAAEILSWTWEFGDGSSSTEKDPIHIFQKEGTYEVTLTGYDVYGCSAVETNTIQVNAPEKMVVIPNAFSPNGDGLNDTFLPKLKGVTSFTLEVFNTWGEKLFVTESLETAGWDGTYRGQQVPPGNYLYRITYTLTSSGITHTRSGGITLIR